MPCLYVDLRMRTAVDSQHIVTLEKRLKRGFPILHKLRASQLSRALDIAAASRDARPIHH